MCKCCHDDFEENDYFDANKEAFAVALLMASHAEKCGGIKVQGNTANFCGCVTNEMKASIYQLHANWHNDMIQRVRAIKDENGLIEKRDVVFLLSENRKW